MNGRVIERLKPYVPEPVRQTLNRTLRFPARRFVARTLQPQTEARLATAGLYPINRVGPDDVVVAAAMKSGNHWFRFLIAGAIFGVDVGLAPPRVAYTLVPDVDYDRLYFRYAPTVFFKSHELPRAEIRRVVYLLRDGRDVMVSLFHHLSAMRSWGNVPFLEMVRGVHDPCKWHEHVQAWMSNPYGAQMIVIRYEDLLADGVKELQRLCEFVGVERDPAHLEWALANARIDRMRGFEQRFGAMYHPDWDRNKPFFRRGEAGSHRDEMPPEVLEAFLERAGPTLREMGYL